MKPSEQWFEVGWIAHGFARELVLIYPVYAIMMGQHGVSPFQLSLLLLLWSGSVAVLEVPSGALGDRFSRPGLLAAAGLIKASCYLLWLLFPTFLGFLAGFLLWGLGSSLRSGTAEALLHDTLAAKGRAGSFERVYGRGRAAGNVGAVAAFILGGWLAGEVGYFWPLVLSGGGPILGAIIALLFFREVPRTVSDSNEAASGDGRQAEGTYLGLMTSGLREARRKPALLRVIGLLSTSVVVAGVADEFIGPFLDDKGDLSLAGIGVAYAAVGVGAVIGGILAHRVLTSTIRGVGFLLLGGSAFLWLALFSPGWLAVLSLVVYFGVVEAGEVLLGAQVQREIEGPGRATITSLAGLGQECSSIFLLGLAGVGAELGGWLAGILLLALVGTVSAAAFSRVRS